MCSGRDVVDVALAPVGLQVAGVSGANAVHNVARGNPLSKNAKAAGAADAVGAGAGVLAPAGAGGLVVGTAPPVAPAAATGGTAAGAGAATGAASGVLTVKDVAMTAAAVAGTASAAYALYAAKNAPKPPETEKPPPPPQAGQTPIDTRRKNLFGDDGPFSRDSTFLTGPGGVAPGSTNLGRNILLGN